MQSTKVELTYALYRKRNSKLLDGFNKLYLLKSFCQCWAKFLELKVKSVQHITVLQEVDGLLSWQTTLSFGTDKKCHCFALNQCFNKSFVHRSRNEEITLCSTVSFLQKKTSKTHYANIKAIEGRLTGADPWDQSRCEVTINIFGQKVL